ncbi:hypothetical protein KRX57_10830 [Weeksellaceae bacterium TAE3-ERU29]|nr:hypothetical protein [Weeksellaceae bacterium TAE3-ERU29]
MNRYFLHIILFLFISTTAKAQEINNVELPNTIKEIRLHYPGVPTFGVFKPLNEKDLVGGKIGGTILPVMTAAVYLEYRHYFSPMNNAKNVSKGSFLYAVKPFAVYFKSLFDPKESSGFGISGAFGYEWKSKSGFFFRPSIEPAILISSEADVLESSTYATMFQSFASTVAIGYKW